MTSAPKSRRMFVGLALGGPLDGKSISHESDIFKVAEQMPLKPFVSFDELAIAAISLDVFEYVHFKTPGGHVWIPKAVKKGDRYEHKLYEHPLDYIFSKLIRGYKPEGY